MQPLLDDPIPGRPRRANRFPVFFWVLVVLSVLTMAAGAWWLLAYEFGSGVASVPPPQALAQPAQAIDFQLNDLAGRPVRLSDYRGKVVLLNFWATWCPPCRAEMPDLEALYQEYGGPRDFVVIGIDVEEGPELTGPFAKQSGLTFPLLPDAEGKVSTYRYFVRSLPTSYIIDREGKVRYTWTGQQSRRNMLSRLETVW